MYGVDETPPLLTTLLSALRHVAVLATDVVYPLLVFRLAGVPLDAMRSEDGARDPK